MSIQSSSNIVTVRQASNHCMFDVKDGYRSHSSNITNSAAKNRRIAKKLSNKGLRRQKISATEMSPEEQPSPIPTTPKLAMDYNYQDDPRIKPKLMRVNGKVTAYVG